MQFQGLGGNDTFTIDSNGAATAGGSVDFVKFLISVDGGTGANGLNLEDFSKTTGAIVTVTSTTIGTATGDTFFGSCGALDYSNLATIALDMSNAAGVGDVVNVNSTSAATTIHGNGGDDQFNVGNSDLSNIHAPVTVFGDAGTDSLTVDDHTRTNAVDYHVDPTSIEICATPTDTPIAIFNNTLEFAKLIGTQDINQFDVTPNADTEFTIDGQNLRTSPGDYLSVRFAGTTDPKLVFTNTGISRNGMWEFANRKNVDFLNIERFNFFPVVVYSADAAKNGKPTVVVVNADDPTDIVSTFQAYESGGTLKTTYREGVRVAVGDINGDGIPEIITAPGHDDAPLVKIFDLSGTLLESFNAYAVSYIGGVNVAVGDVDGDGLNDIILSPSRGQSEIRVFSNQSATTPAVPFSATNYQHFLAFKKTFIGGATVAAGDVLDGGPVNSRGGNHCGCRLGMRDTVLVFNASSLVGMLYPLTRRRYRLPHRFCPSPPICVAGFRWRWATLTPIRS